MYAAHTASLISLLLLRRRDAALCDLRSAGAWVHGRQRRDRIDHHRGRRRGLRRHACLRPARCQRHHRSERYPLDVDHAELVGVEPTWTLRPVHAFQACCANRYAAAPRACDGRLKRMRGRFHSKYR